MGVLSDVRFSPQKIAVNTLQVHKYASHLQRLAASKGMLCSLLAILVQRWEGRGKIKKNKIMLGVFTDF